MIAALLLASSVPQAQAAQQTLGELRANRVKAAANLDAAKSTLRVALRDVRIAKEIYQDAYRSFQRTVAAMYMLDEDGGVEVDIATLRRLRQGIRDAKWQVEVAEQSRERARRLVGQYDGAIALAEAQQYAQASERVQARTTEGEKATISCPVARASAIFDDFTAPRSGGPHRGIDIPAPQGTPARAAWHSIVASTPVGGWMGKGVILRDGANNLWWYAHLSRVDVKVGQRVARGEVIGAVGSSGNSTGPHLHFEIHPRGLRPIDPYSLVAPACGIFDHMTHAERVAAETDEPRSE
jgi:murein DD-endopeptidase MepM/ murein hydrolase activator NlpD